MTTVRVTVERPVVRVTPPARPVLRVAVVEPARVVVTGVPPSSPVVEGVPPVARVTVTGQGVQGEQGPAGAQGPAGPAGDPAPAGVYVQPTQPAATNEFVWFETNVSGDVIGVWVNDA